MSQEPSAAARKLADGFKASFVGPGQWAYPQNRDLVAAQIDAFAAQAVAAPTRERWKEIGREILGPDPLLLSDGVSIWIGHQTFGDDGFEFQTNDESYWDVKPRYYQPLPELPK